MNPKLAKILAGLVLFASGAVVGFFGSRLLGERGPLALVHGDPRHFAEMILHRLSADLDLTEAQQAKLRPLVMDTARKLTEFRKEQEPKIQAIIEKSKEETKALLTPEQREKFTAMMERLDARRKAMERFGPPLPPPGGFGPPPGRDGRPPGPPPGGFGPPGESSLPPGFGPPDMDDFGPPPPGGFGPPPDMFGPDFGPPPHGPPPGPPPGRDGKGPTLGNPEKPATEGVKPAPASETKPQ